MSKLGLYHSSTINAFVADKMNLLLGSDHTFRSIFDLMTRERDNLFLEDTDGYHVTSVTYAQFRSRCISAGRFFSSHFSSFSRDSLIGIHMDNSELWLEVFWGLLMAGFRPVLMNLRLSMEQLEDIIRTYGVSAVVSDGTMFSVQTLTKDRIPALLDGEDALPDTQWADEIALMTSGTSTHIKLCFYRGENIVYQIYDSSFIIRKCTAIKKHYHNHLKLLTFLPFYHVFGLMAVFMWFGFFSRSFVLLRDFSPDTILNTVRKLEVTHIFAVPLLWNTVYTSAMKTIRSKGEAVQAKFEKGMRIYEKLSTVPALANAFSKLAFKEVRSQIFGDSICFLITGGSSISHDTLAFFNAIGYHLADGYGMTEIGQELLAARRLVQYGIPYISINYSGWDSHKRHFESMKRPTGASTAPIQAIYSPKVPAIKALSMEKPSTSVRTLKGICSIS